MEKRELLKDCCAQMGISLQEEQLEQFMTYLSLLLEWNEKMNLTAITEPREVVLKHFADCLSLVPWVEWKKGLRVIDVGTGAGFPGIPVKLACPEIELTLLDSLQKRIGFLQEVGSQLGLSGVEYVHSRAEDGGQNPLYREKFDLCVSRAVANLSTLSEYCLPFVKIGGKFISYKAGECDEEVAASKSSVFLLGGKISDIKKFELGESGRAFVIIDKVSGTPKKYPRKAGTPSKDPL